MLLSVAWVHASPWDTPLPWVPQVAVFSAGADEMGASMLVCPPLMLMAGLAWPALLTPHCFFLCTLRQLWGNISAFTSEPRQEHVCPSPFVILRQSFSCCPGTLCSGWPGTRRYTYLCLPGALPLWLLSLSLPGKACRILLISRPQRLVRRLA